MPPKPRQRKSSVSSKTSAKSSPEAVKTKASKDKEDAAAMPPPPDPGPPLAILEPEMRALANCLKNAVVKTGQVYRFYADTRKLGIQRYAPYPPRSLTSSLGSEVEKYDQLCDAVESRLLRAISVLQRDLARQQQKLQEQQRLKEAEEAAVASRTRSRSKSLSQSPTSSRVPLPSAGPPPVPTTTPVPTPLQTPLSGTSDLPATDRPQLSPSLGRRPSAISLSSLHRPAFNNQKLDLTRIMPTSEEDVMSSLGLASPVTLAPAPKSARPMDPGEIPAELMAAFGAGSSVDVDVDLTVPDADMQAGMTVDVGGRGTADKPIELDLDGLGMGIDMNMDMDMTGMDDLFGDGGGDEGLFSPTGSAAGDVVKNEPLDMDMSLLHAGPDDALLASLQDPSNVDASTSTGAGAANADEKPSEASLTAPPATTPAPSPGAFLAQAGQLDLSGIDFNFSPGMFGGEGGGADGVDVSLDGLGGDAIFDFGQEQKPPGDSSTS